MSMPKEEIIGMILEMYDARKEAQIASWNLSMLPVDVVSSMRKPSSMAIIFCNSSFVIFRLQSYSIISKSLYLFFN